MALAKNPFELDVHERLRLMRDGLINYLGFLISGLVGLFMVPVLLFYLGAESYGLWLAALSLPGLAGILDLGLGISVTRAIAAAADGAREKVASFVSSVGNTLLLFGLVGGVLVAALGIPMSRVLHLSAEAQALAPSVFFLAGVVFFATALLHFARSGLVGLGRFDVANGVSSIHVLVGAAGTLALLLLGQRLLAVAAWQAASSLMAAVVALALLGRIEPHFRFRLGQFERETVRARLSFSLSSQLTTAALKVIWESPPLLIGLVRGSASIVPFYVGQRFPVAISQVAWCAAEVLYPAASSEGEPQARSRTRELLQVGIRWIVVLVLPLCVGLWILAPALLQAWLGVVDTDTLLVLRLTTAAVLMDAVGVGAFYVLWGRGEARTVFQLVGALALLELPLGAWLLAEMGVAGLAVAMLVALTLGSVALLYSAARVCGVRVGELLAPVPRGLALPITACAVATWATSHLPNLGGWATIISSSLAGGAAYAVSLYFRGAREEEKTLLRESVQWPVPLGRTAVGKLRRLLRHVGPLRSTFYLGLALRDMLRDPWREATVVDSDYHRGLDPWKYESNPLEKARHQRAVALLDAVRGQKPFACALEVGCAEGVFTKLLAGRCQDVLAVDLAPTALERARSGYTGVPQVRFQQWDLRHDPLRETFDLIVIMDVLSYFVRPRALREARDKLVAALRPGGYLLVGEERLNELYETAWWGRHVVRGGQQIIAFFAQHAALRVVATESDDSHVLRLLQKLA